MKSIELTSRPSDASAISKNSVSRISRGLILILLSFIFSGGLNYSAAYSSYLSNGCYIMLFICILLCLFTEDRVSRNLKPAWPYLYWMALYTTWGTLVSPLSSLVVPEAIRMLFKNMLILTSIGVALIDDRNRSILSNLFQIAAIVNFTIQIWEMFSPNIIVRIAYILNADATAFDISRPAGLWSNPDEAAFAFLFAIFISSKDSSILAWIGRISAITGIYLSASRTGAYLLFLCGGLYVFYIIRHRKIRVIHISMIFCSVALLVLLLSVTYSMTRLFDRVEFSENYRLSRIIDLSETDTDYTRRDVTAAALKVALDAPIYGYGIFSMQDPLRYLDGRLQGVGAHNIYISILGEAGSFGFLGYVLVLLTGIINAFKARISAIGRLFMAQMWISYLMIGFVWHNQLTSMSGMIYIGILYYFPKSIEVTRD